MADITLHTSSATVYASYLLEEQYEAGINERASLQLELSRGDLTLSNDYTVSGTESYKSITIPAGTTLTVPDGAVLAGQRITVNGTLDNDGTVAIYDGIGTLLDYDEYSGNYKVTEMLNGILKYDDTVPNSAPIENLLIGIEPAPDLQASNIPGVWGLIENVEDTRNAALSNEQMTLTVRVLARFDEYDSISDVQAALEV